MTEATTVPSEREATEIAQEQRGETVTSVVRFPMGLAHWVYDVAFATGDRIVVRLTKPEFRGAMLGAVHWSTVLRPLGVPLPELLAHGEHRGFPYVVLERLAGEDLGLVYEQLTSAQRGDVAREVCSVQQLVATLPDGAGYGSLSLPTDPHHPTWRAYLDEILASSRQRIEQAGVASTRPVERVEQAAARLDRYFASIRPTPFLDDATTKNVLVHEGRFSGLVDVDELGFGDTLLTIGLTRASLLAAGRDSEYTDFWLAALTATAEQRTAVAFYTALYCVVFMGEQGQRFNREVAPPDMALLARLESLLEQNLLVVAG